MTPPGSTDGDADEPSRFRILKFGGSSLADPERIRRVVELVRQSSQQAPTIVVVSALGGVTDELLDVVEAAVGGVPGQDGRIAEIGERHRKALGALADAAELDPLVAEQDGLLAQLEDLLRGVSLLHECSPRTLASVLSFGERLSAPIVAAALRRGGVPAEPCDARELIVTDDTFDNAWVDTEATYQRLGDHFDAARPLQVVTGFIAATPGGETTTLGRSGSDYTATLLGAATGAEVVEIWTDVDGVMSADPRLVPEAYPLDSLSYPELMELSHWGARVMHPAAVHPARRARVPVRIRNTFNPGFPGTLVVERPSSPPGHPVRGIASINQVTLMRLEGPGLQGVPGIAERVFGTLARERISVILITQASSERSICFAIEPRDAQRAVRSLEKQFALERSAGLVDAVAVEERCSVIAAVGESMREVPGISGRLFGVLGHHRINVRAIAQGSSELNISLVVSRDDEERALRAIHSAFFGERDSAQLFLAGTGRVGTALLTQLGGQIQTLEAQGTDLVLAGVARSRVAVVRPAGLQIGGWSEALVEGDTTFEGMVESILSSDHQQRIFVDCTASTTVAGTYERLLADGVAVVTANKLAFAEAASRFEKLRDLGRRGMGLYFETTVGAGLPVLRTVDDLVSTGDRIRRIEGALSGTLGFLFVRLMEGARFSQALREAEARGFTEPDPREDLGGRDVARKLVILARVAGIPLEPGDVEIAPLLPNEPWVDGPLDAFWEGLPGVDGAFEAQRTKALAREASLCYLGRIENGAARVDLTEIAADHPCAGLGGSDNLIAVTTDRYADTPLVVRGPGAGPEVTAAGVFADVLRALAEAP